MLGWLLRKFLFMAVSLLAVATATFFLMKAVPGDPFSQEQALPKAIHESLRSHYGLNDPLWMQYGKYLKSLMQWNLGPSLVHLDRTVDEIIAKGFPVSAILGSSALALALFFGVMGGCLCAILQGRFLDRLGLVLMALCLSMPGFILAVMLQYYLAMKLQLFPVARWGHLSQAVLPSIALAALPAAFIARLLRANLVEAYRQDYIKTARSKGLSETRILLKHCLPNALPPIFSYFGQLAANILVGSFVIEKIFAIPGLGYWFISSINNRDYTVIMGTTIFYSAIFLTFGFLADLAYAWFDPRIMERDGNR